MTSLNRLERLGWEVAARELLDLRPLEIAMLAALAVDNPGRILSADRQAGLSGRDRGAENDPRLRVSVRLARVRGALVDVGFPPTSLRHEAGLGYVVPARWASLINQSVRLGVVDLPEVGA